MRLYGDSDALGTLPLTTPCVLGNEYLALFSFFFLKLAMHDKQFFLGGGSLPTVLMFFT